MCVCGRVTGRLTTSIVVPLKLRYSAIRAARRECPVCANCCEKPVRALRRRQKQKERTKKSTGLVTQARTRRLLLRVCVCACVCRGEAKAGKQQVLPTVQLQTGSRSLQRENTLGSFYCKGVALPRRWPTEGGNNRCSCETNDFRGVEGS